MRKFLQGLTLQSPGLWISGVALMLVMGSVAQVYAQTRGIGVTPAIDELILEEGQASARLDVNIANATDKEVRLRVSTLDFGALDASGGIAFLGATGQEVAPRGLSRWMALDRDTLRIGAGQTETISLTVENNDSLSPGGHYGAIVVSALNDGLPGGDAVAVQPAVSTLVLLKKRGGETYSLEMMDVKTNKSLLSLPKTAMLEFKNTGNVHVVPRGTVQLVSPTGSVIRRGVINEQSGFVLPESTRNYEVDFSGSSPWLPGRYKLVTEWRFDGQESFNQTVEYIWYIGKATLLLIGILCSLIVLIMYVKYRRRPVSRY